MDMTTTENLFWSMFYNGYEERIERLYWDMKNFADKARISDYDAFNRPDYFYFEEDEGIEVFWMIFVQNFGEYGTSPRSGWIYKEQAKEAADWLRVNIAKTWNYQEED